VLYALFLLCTDNIDSIDLVRSPVSGAVAYLICRPTWYVDLRELVSQSINYINQSVSQSINLLNL